jgi:hypothetical protein
LVWAWFAGPMVPVLIIAVGEHACNIDQKVRFSGLKLEQKGL